MAKKYIGDSVYYQFDGDRVTLTTENGQGPNNTIVLDIEVIIKLLQAMRQERVLMTLVEYTLKQS